MTNPTPPSAQHGGETPTIEEQIAWLKKELHDDVVYLRKEAVTPHMAILASLQQLAAKDARIAELESALANGFCDLREEVLRLTEKLNAVKPDAERLRQQLAAAQAHEAENTAIRMSLEKDAMRYRFIRKQETPSAELCMYYIPSGNDYGYEFRSGDALDWAIDAAIDSHLAAKENNGE